MTVRQPPVTGKTIRDALRTVCDPELGIDIVSLGLVYNVAVEKGRATVTMTLTTPACPFASIIIERVRQVVVSVRGVSSVSCELTFDPPWDPSMVDSSVPFPQRSTQSPQKGGAA